MTFITLLIFVQFYLGLSQYIPPDLKFDGIKENWRYLVEDKNFIKSDSDLTSSKYDNIIPLSVKIKGNYVYILESTYSQLPNAGDDGTLIHKIDYNTGEVLWTNYNNAYAGLKWREYYDGQYMDILENGDVEIFGYRDIENTRNKLNFLYFFGSPIKKIIDGNTGLLKEEKYGQDTTKRGELATKFGSRFLKNSKGEHLYVSMKVYVKDSILKETILFWKIKENFDLDPQPFDSILHDTGIKAKYPISFLRPMIRPLNKDTLLLVFAKIDPQNDKYILNELKYHYVNISDIDDIRIDKVVDVTADCKYPFNILANPIYIETSGNDAFLFQRLWNKELSKEILWFTWRDKDGNLKARVDPFFADEYYYRFFGSIMAIKDDVLYMHVRNEMSNWEIFDIVKIKPGNNDVTKIGQWKVMDSDSLDLYPYFYEFLPDDKLFFTLGVTRYFKTNLVQFDISTSFLFFYNFNLSDFGITLSNNEGSRNEKSITIYPNPASTSISINCEDNDASMIEIIDRLGRVVYRDKSRDCEELSIDISGNTSGLYFVRFVDDSGKVTGRGKFVKE